MTASKTYRIYSAINIGKAESGLCIPLFTHQYYNTLFTPVTDELLNIVEFQPTNEFSSRMIHLPAELDIDHYYTAGDCLPIVALDSGRIIAINGNDVLDIIRILSDMQDNYGEIVRELIENLKHIALKKIDRRASQNFVPASLGPSLQPKGSTLWLDNAIVDLKLADINGKITEEQAGSARLKLLAWAKDLGEHSTTPIFRYFLSAAKIAERAGVEVEDIVATALLRRMTEEIPRDNNVIALVHNFRQRYERGPLESVIELSETDQSEFSDRAKQVLVEYFSYINEKIDSGNKRTILSATYAADSGDQWPNNIRDKLILIRKRYLDNILSDISDHQDMIQEFDRIKELMRQRVIKRIRVTDTDRLRVRLAAQKLLNSSSRIYENIDMVDALSKSLSGNIGKEHRKRSTGLDYRLMGLNEDVMTSIFSALDQHSLLEDI